MKNEDFGVGGGEGPRGYAPDQMSRDPTQITINSWISSTKRHPRAMYEVIILFKLQHFEKPRCDTYMPTH